MTFGWRVVRLMMCFAALVFAGIAAAEEPVVGKAAPDFQVTTMDGKVLTLADFKGDVLVLSFWATWSAPCKKELRLLNSYYRIQKKSGLRVLAVTTEDSVPLHKLQEAAAALAMPVVRQFKGDYLPVKTIPTNYVIDREGVLRYAKAVAWTLDDLNAVLVPLLRRHESPDETEGPVSAKRVGG
jgi:cytochrome c biogenesis protein CcmG, thiol:disulfide interchange protein DsbE